MAVNVAITSLAGPSVASTESPQRLFSLDVLRGLAIALVLIRHFPPTEIRLSGMFEEVVQWLMSIGHVGVDLFFVLSGFLISRLIYAEYDRTGGFDAVRFWLRRGFKIWPAYFVAYGGMTALRVFWELWRGDRARAGELLDAAGCNAVFMQNYLACERWSHSWSLAVEEHFYTVFAVFAGVLAWWAARKHLSGIRTFKTVAAACILASAAALLMRIDVLLPEYTHATASIAYYRSHLRMDSLCCGVLLGYCVHYRIGGSLVPRIRWPLGLVALMAGLAWPTLWTKGESFWFESIGFTLIYLSFGVLVLGAAQRPDFGLAAPRVPRAMLRGLAWLGVYSYTIYLAHSILFGIPGVETLRQAVLGVSLPTFGVGFSLWLDRLAYLAASIGLGVALSHVIERPFLRLRARLLPSRRRGLWLPVA